jgi:hypothetical protein
MRETSVRYRKCILPTALDTVGLNLARIATISGNGIAFTAISFK